MTSFKLCKYLLKQNKKYLIISAIYFAVVILLCVFMIAMMSSYMSSLSFFKAFSKDTGVYFKNTTRDPVDIDELGLAGYKSVENVYHIIDAKVIDETFSVDCMIYSNYISENLKIDCASGKWYTDVAKSPGEVNAVIDKKSNKKVGDRFTIKIGDDQYVIHITGILSDSYEYYSPLGYGDLNMLKSNTLNSTISEYPKLFFNALDINKSYLKNNSNYGQIILFDDDISIDDFNKNIEIIKTSGNVKALSHLYETEKAVYFDYLKMLAPPFVVIALLCLVSNVSLMCVYMEKNKTTISSFVLNGCLKRQFVFAVCWYFLGCLGFSIILYAIILSLVTKYISVSLLLALILPIALIAIVVVGGLLFGNRFYKKYYYIREVNYEKVQI